jgi:hypothetical protein
MITDTIIENGAIVQKGNIFNATLEDMIKQVEADRLHIERIDKGRTYIIAEYINDRIRLIEEL